MKKTVCALLALCLALPALAPMAEEAAPATSAEAFIYDGSPFLLVGDNLYESPCFGGAEGREAPGWYVGANNTTSWDGKIPDPKTGANLTPLESVVKGSEAEAKDRQAFYYSSGGALGSTGSDYFLCEFITDAHGSYWNGGRALLGYVPVEPNKTYYFSYFVSSWGSVANSSVRFGAINSADYCENAANGKIKWSGEGGVNVDQYDGENMTQMGGWAKKEAMITTGPDADYFFFNLYWLQDTDYVCVNGFTLREAEPASVKAVEAPPKGRVYAGEAPALPSRLNVIFESASAEASAQFPAIWGEADTSRDGDITVAGEVEVCGRAYPAEASVTVYSDSLSEDYTITKALRERDGELTANIGVNTDKTDGLMAVLALYDPSGRLAAVDVRLISGQGELTLALPTPMDSGFTARTFVWSREYSVPLSAAKSEKIDVSEGGRFMSASDVKLLDGMFKTARDTNEKYLMAVEPDRLLAPCLESAGMEPKAERYGGWEAYNYNNQWGGKGISGHSLGHWLSAVSSACVESEQYGAELKSRLDYAVGELARIQRTTGGGYVGGLDPAPFDEAFAGSIRTPDGINLNDGWVPWYSVHKIYQGLIDAYVVAGNEQALDVAVKFADWAVEGTKGLTDEQMQKMLGVEHGGMNDVFAQLYSITGREDYLAAAVRFTHNAILDPLANGRDELSGKHANTQIPKIIGAAAVYEQDNSREDYKAAAEFFWNRVTGSRSFVIGGNSVSEHFENDGLETLHIKDAETCNTFNMIKLTEHLFSWEHRAEYMDYVENALYNDILGSQDPETGNKMYFTSMLPGHFRIYGTPEDSWWCCTGSGMENPGRYTKCIYYKDKDELYVNLYIPSQAVWREAGLTLRMETDFPYSETVKITVEKGGAEAAVKLRAPSWLAGDMGVKLNGQAVAAEAVDGYVELRREWSEGDEIELTLPMALSVYFSRDDKNKVAFKYGPAVLAASFGEEAAGLNVRDMDTRVSELNLPANTVPVPNILGDASDPESFITPADVSALVFKIDAAHTSNGRELTLVPFWSIHHSFHSVYWYMNDGGADDYERRLNNVTVDSVEPDGQQDESGHNLKHSDNDAQHNGILSDGGKSRFWRDAWGVEGAFFSYDMAVLPEGQNYLCAAYWGGDGPFTSGGVRYERDFSIYIDGEKIASQTINNNSPGRLYRVFYDIPEGLTAGKEKVTVKFAANGADKCAGGVTEVRITREIIEEKTE